MELVSRSEAETLEIGRQIGQLLMSPRVLRLIGDLGSGKTVLTQGICEGLQMDSTVAVHSPSFTLVNEYPSPTGTIYHIDLYRLETLRDLYSIGLEDILAADSIVIVEWAEKLRLPVDHPLDIRIDTEARPNVRRFQIEPALEGLRG
jgi:tRNA threonylcarbamoyladenosine biosynthesis protein TsaE